MLYIDEMYVKDRFVMLAPERLQGHAPVYSNKNILQSALQNDCSVFAAVVSVALEILRVHTETSSMFAYVRCECI